MEIGQMSRVPGTVLRHRADAGPDRRGAMSSDEADVRTPGQDAGNQSGVAIEDQLLIAQTCQIVQVMRREDSLIFSSWTALGKGTARAGN